MSNHFKMAGSTPSTTFLCETCAHAHRIKGEHMTDARVLCGAGNSINPLEIAFRVTECNNYYEQKESPIRRFKQEATYFVTDGEDFYALTAPEFRRFENGERLSLIIRRRGTGGKKTRIRNPGAVRARKRNGPGNSNSNEPVIQ